MKCVKCGYVFNEGMFCPECGAKYNEEEAERIEAEQRETEKRRKEEEEIRKEDLKRKVEEKKVQDEIRRQEEKEKRELELEKAKVEQEKLAVERAAHEAELARQQNERARIEQENRVRMEEQERKHQEELARSFNGVLYNTIEERNAAESKYNEQVVIEKKVKKANSLAVWSFVLSIATYPLIMTMILWFPSIILSIVFGVMALKEKTTKKGLAIAGLIVNGLFFLICVLGMILSFGIGAEESSDESVQISWEESVAITDEVQEEKEEVRVDEAENQQDIQDISLDPVESEAYLVRLNNEIGEYDSAYIGDEWNYDESNQMSGMLYDERGFDLIINFPFQNTKETKKLIDFYEEILKATDSEFVNVEYGRKGLLDGSKQYKQTLDSTTYKYYGGMKNGLPNGKGFVVEYISNYGVYLPKVLGNFKKGQLDGYAINFSVEPIFQVISEGNYKKGEENGEYVIYSSKLLNYELGIDIDVEVIDQYQSYIRERKYATNSMETILIDVPLTPVYIFGTGKLKNGEMTGNWISYYVNGNIKSEMKMNGNEGKGTFYNMDGTVQYKGEIKDGKYHGTGTLYKEDGSVEYKGKFKNGEIDS